MRNDKLTIKDMDAINRVRNLKENHYWDVFTETFPEMAFFIIPALCAASSIVTIIVLGVN